MSIAPMIGVPLFVLINLWVRLAPLGARQNRCTGKPALMPGADTAAPSVRLGNDDLRENQCDGYAARWSIKG